jgi:hypothetical protein
MFWGNAAPMSMVRAHLRMMPVLQAEEALHRIDQHLVGSGRMKRHAVSAYVRQLERTARRTRRKAERRQPSASDIPMLNAMGIKTVM